MVLMLLLLGCAMIEATQKVTFLLSFEVRLTFEVSSTPGIALSIRSLRRSVALSYILYLLFEHVH